MLRDHVMKKFHEVEIVGTESPRNKEIAAAISSGFWSLFRKKPATTAALTHDLKELQLGDSNEGCIKDDVNGVNEVDTDVEEELLLHRKKKLGRNAEIVPMKTDSGSRSGYSNNGKGVKTKEERRSGSLKINNGGEKKKKEKEGGRNEGMNTERVPGGVRIKEKKGDGGGSSREKKKEKEGGGRGEKKEFGGGEWSRGFDGEKKEEEEEEEVSGGYGYRNGEEKEEVSYGRGKKKEEAVEPVAEWSGRTIITGRR